jgi:5'-methylthioadenosine phosphorylase
MVKIGIIGGSGLENPDILKSPAEKNIETPYGHPSSPLLCGSINGIEIVILSRHGRKHTIPPSKVNYRANIYALREIGCTHIITTTACGSLREEIRRGDLVIPDQFIDFTRHRDITFFEEFEPGKMNHTPMADPFDRDLRDLIIMSAAKIGLRIHERGTLITIEGPRFSTRAESKMFRIWGADVINMSVAPEVTLANELGLPYASIAMSTDYDCWKEDEAPVSWEEVIRVFENNVGKVIRLLQEVIPEIKKKEKTSSYTT